MWHRPTFPQCWHLTIRSRQLPMLACTLIRVFPRLVFLTVQKSHCVPNDWRLLLAAMLFQFFETLRLCGLYGLYGLHGLCRCRAWRCPPMYLVATPVTWTRRNHERQCLPWIDVWRQHTDHSILSRWGDLLLHSTSMVSFDPNHEPPATQRVNPRHPHD